MKREEYWVHLLRRCGREDIGRERIMGEMKRILGGQGSGEVWIKKSMERGKGKAGREGRETNEKNK